MDYKYMWQDFVTCVRGATNGTFIHSFMYLFPYIHLQVQPKDVQTVTIQYTIHKLTIQHAIELLQSRMQLFLKIKKKIHP